MLQDNMQAVWNTINLRSRAGLWRQNRVLRGIAHQLRRSGLIVHVVYIPSEMQPADPLSRVGENTPEAVENATCQALVRWKYTRRNIHRLQFKGPSFVSV